VKIFSIESDLGQDKFAAMLALRPHKEKLA
jgi:hypothetical protein